MQLASGLGPFFRLPCRDEANTLSTTNRPRSRLPRTRTLPFSCPERLHAATLSRWAVLLSGWKIRRKTPHLLLALASVLCDVPPPSPPSERASMSFSFGIHNPSGIFFCPPIKPVTVACCAKHFLRCCFVILQAQLLPPALRKPDGEYYTESSLLCSGCHGLWTCLHAGWLKIRMRREFSYEASVRMAGCLAPYACQPSLVEQVAGLPMVVARRGLDLLPLGLCWPLDVASRCQGLNSKWGAMTLAEPPESREGRRLRHGPAQGGGRNSIILCFGCCLRRIGGNLPDQQRTLLSTFRQAF